MRKTRISLLILIALSLSAIPFGLFIVNTAATVELPEYEPVDWQSGLAGDVFMPEISTDVPESAASAGLQSSPAAVGEEVWDWYLWASGFNPYMTLRAEREYVQVYVANDLSFPAGDVRNDDPLNLLITDEMCGYLADEFNEIIYNTEIDYYGMSEDRFGNNTIFELINWPGPFAWEWVDTDNGQKVILKVMNIIDDNYYDPTFPGYVVGFFSPTYDGYYDRNMIHIDAWKWWQRLGDEGHQWIPERPDLEVTRPNLYESTTAHEYQHLIHNDHHEAPESWMNEASSLFSEPLCGYELDAGQIEWFLATPDNSLTEWGDQGGINILADYGSSFLWALFLTSHYGFDFMGRYVQGGVAGVEGINLLLPEGVDFLDVFHDWRIANLLQTDTGPYAYTSFGFTFEGLEPLRIYEVEGKHFDWLTASEAFGETLGGTTAPGDLQYPTGIYEVSAYGSDYFVLDDLRGLTKFFFNGEDIEPFGWSMTDMGWYSGAADLYNALLYSAPYTVVEGDFLTLNTYWEIEDYWDFGFVQVSTDGGETWTSLANVHTTDVHDPNAHPDIIANLPGLTGWSTLIFGDDDYYVFHDISFDLSAYVGQEVMFGFRYMTDWAFTYEGWYIADASVGGNSLELTPEYPEIDFMVTAVMKYEHKWFEFSFNYDMWLCDSNEFGFTYLLGTKWLKVYMIVTPMMDIGFADYEFKATNKVRRGMRCLVDF